MALPTITLAADFVAQTEYKASLVKVIQIDDQTDQKSLRVFVQLGTNNSFKYWIPVQNSDAYSVDWTNADVEAAIRAYFSA
jgi:hypothetical protein